MRNHRPYPCVPWLLLLLALTHLQCSVSQDCPLEIWVFDSLADCVNPEAKATLYADNQCHSLSSRPDYPGNYIAKCDANGKLDFQVSGCSDAACGSCSTQRDQASSLYGRTEPLLVQEVQDPRNGPARFECFSFTNGLEQIFFAFYGDCSAPGCSGSPPPPPPTRSPVKAPTRSPVKAPTRSPVKAPTRAPARDPTGSPVRAPTRAPVRDPTQSPVRAPTRAPVKAPTGSPVRTPVTNRPTGSPVKAPVTSRPTLVPTILPTLAPVTASPTTLAPSRSPLDSKTTLYPTRTPVTESPTAQPIQRFSDTARVEMLLSPISQLLDQPSLERWAFVTSSRVRFAMNVIRAQAFRIEQEIIPDEDDNDALLITFDITVDSVNSDTTALTYYLETFDEDTERALYKSNLTNGVQGVEALEPVVTIVAAKSRYPLNSTTPDTPTHGQDTNSSTRATDMAMISIVSASVAALGLIAGLLVFRITRRRRTTPKPELTDSEPEITVEVEDCHPVDPRLILPGPDNVHYTHDIELRNDNDDDISTLGGYTGIVTDTVKDDATASVHEDYDFDNNMYRSNSNDQSFSNTASTMFSSHTALERLGAMLFSDDKSLDQQFLDDRMNDPQTRRKRIVPFEIRAPPGLLGMVVDTPVGGGTPVVRAIQPDSVLTGKVQIGDRLLSVNYKDISGLNAQEVSNLISFKQNEERLLKFVRIEEGA